MTLFEELAARGLVEATTAPEIEKLLEVQNGISRNINEKYLGKTCKVLIDGFSEDNRYTYTGRTDGFKLVHINGASGYMGQWVDVEIDRTSTWALFGSIK